MYPLCELMQGLSIHLDHHRVLQVVCSLDKRVGEVLRVGSASRVVRRLVARKAYMRSARVYAQGDWYICSLVSRLETASVDTDYQEVLHVYIRFGVRETGRQAVILPFRDPIGGDGGHDAHTFREA